MPIIQRLLGCDDTLPVNLHADISTLEDFQHVIPVNDLFQLLGCP